MAIILAVDDNPAILMTVESYLSTLGHTIWTADSAVEALKVIRGDALPQIVLTDIVMPGSIDGIGLAQIVRDSYPDIGVLLMTGWSYDDEHGFPVLEKPFELPVLGQWVDAYLARTVSQV